MALYNNLKKFGESVINELDELFEPGSVIVIPFPKSALEYICEKNDLSYRQVEIEFVDYFNLKLSSYAADTYCDCACCVFQVAVAYDCVAKGVSGFNEDFSNRLGISQTELQKLYSETKRRYPAQEEIWINFRDFLFKKTKLSLQIPQQTTNSGRYVQYPLSQRLFTFSF